MKQHLLSFGYDRLKQTGERGARKKTTNKWFETQDSISYSDDFNRQKIGYSEIVQQPQFYLDKNGDFFAEATAFILTGEHLEYLYHILHSKATTFFFKTFYAGGGLGENGYRYKKAFLEKLPVPEPLEQINFNENNVDHCVYYLYQLSQDEISYIKKHYKLSL